MQRMRVVSSDPCLLSNVGKAFVHGDEGDAVGGAIVHAIKYSLLRTMIMQRMVYYDCEKAHAL